MTAQEEYYFRQQQWRRRALYNYAISQARIANIKNAIAAGVDVWHDPEYAQEVLMLETQYGKGIFVFEDNSQKAIVKEKN